MNLDQRLTRAARRLADGVDPPAVDLDGIRAQARRRQQRRASMVTAAVLTAVTAGGALFAINRNSGAPDPVEPAPAPTRTVTSIPTPVPNPFPKSMTPPEVVAHPDTLLSTVAVDPTDPDTRLSIWSVSCTRPCPQRPPTSFEALALTSDGYETTTYVHPPFEVGVDLQVTSPRAGLFLVVDGSNGGEWLVDVDGTVRSVTRVADEIRPADPRRWFPCVGRWRDTWCSLDPDTATVHEWPTAWDGSAARPDSGDSPWGANPEPRSTGESGLLEAWWDTDSGRQVRTLAEAHVGDYLLGSPPGVMSFWAVPDGATVDLYTSRDGGASWERDTRAAPGLTGDLQVQRTADGTLLACSIYPRLVVWRAEESGGPFRKVYEQQGAGLAETSGAGLWTQGNLVRASANATVAVSEDDGLTWTTIRGWR